MPYKINKSYAERKKELLRLGYTEAKLVDGYSIPYSGYKDLPPLKSIFFLYEVGEDEVYEEELKQGEKFNTDFFQNYHHIVFTGFDLIDRKPDLNLCISMDFGDAYLSPKIFVNFNIFPEHLGKESVDIVIQHLNNLIEIEPRIGDILETRFFGNPSLDSKVSMEMDPKSYYYGSFNIRSLICSLFEKGPGGEIPIAAIFDKQNNKVVGYKHYEPYFKTDPFLSELALMMAHWKPEIETKDSGFLVTITKKIFPHQLEFKDEDEILTEYYNDILVELDTWVNDRGYTFDCFEIVSDKSFTFKVLKKE